MTLFAYLEAFTAEGKAKMAMLRGKKSDEHSHDPTLDPLIKKAMRIRNYKYRLPLHAPERLYINKIKAMKIHTNILPSNQLNR